MRRTSAFAILAALIVSGCATSDHQPTTEDSGPGARSQEPGASSVRFRDITREAGIRFTLGHGGRHPLTILETVGCGGAFLDYDRDGRLDILLVGQPTRAPETPCALYRNLGDETGGEPVRFADVTRPAGLDRSALWMGCAVADYDGDGYPDILLTGYGVLALLRNEPAPTGAGRRFVDVTVPSGLRADAADWFTSAGWADVDRDGWLDLYIARYVRFDAKAPQSCSLGLDGSGQRVPGTCGPELYAEQQGVFYRNLKGRRFVEATRAFGLGAAHGKGLGVAFGDFDDDGWPDLYVANDRMPGDLFRNLGGTRFASVGAERGVSYSGDSRPQAGMGVDWGDYNQDGRLDLIVTTFFLERKSLYRNEGAAGFQEVSDEAGLSPAIRFVGWGNRWIDIDNDGRLDWVVANGHAVDNMEKVDPAQPYAQPTQLFRNTGAILEEIGAQASPAFRKPIAGRALCSGDLDNDGRIDLLVTNAEGEPLLLRNESATPNHWLRVVLEGRDGNRDAIGARVRARLGNVTQTREVTTGGSYLAASDPRLHFGLGAANRVTRLYVRWPTGGVTELSDVAVNREVIVRQEDG
jgi:hypothetical protein